MDFSVGSINSWAWTFDGGEPAISTEQNPTVIYNTPGIYNVSLIISDGTISDTISKENYIVINAYPDVPTMPAGDDEVCTNLVAFTEYITAGGSNIDSFIWELLPAEAGTISGNGAIGTVEWTMNWEGTAQILVKGENNNCGESEFSEAFEVACEVCTGINPKTSVSDIHIFPNPTNGELYLESNGDLKGTIISVINPLNQVIYEKQVEFSNEQKLKINLSAYAEGVYYLRIKSDDKERIEKIILN